MGVNGAQDLLRMPDPTLTANIYAGGLLSELLKQAIVPFWREALCVSPDRSFLWVVRYGRRGEHLKIRLHTPWETRERLQYTLSKRVQQFFNEVDVIPEPPRIARDDAPAIDFEDEEASLAPDRSLIWTTYRRSHVSLAEAPWLENDLLVAHSCECLASGCDVVLSAMASEPKLTVDKAQRLLLKVICAGFSEVAWSFEDTVNYLQYHRDWLVRFFVSEPVAREKFLDKVKDLRPGNQIIGQIWDLFQRQQSIADKPAMFKGFVSRLTALSAYAGGFNDVPEFQIDPYASKAVFLPIFKVLHGVANQLGVPPLEEARVYDLVLAAFTSRGQAILVGGAE
jgi:hypothetical protein